MSAILSYGCHRVGRKDQAVNCTMHYEDYREGPPEVKLLLAILDRAKRDYMACPQEDWGKISGESYDNTAGITFHTLSRRALMWATAKSREPFSYFWIRELVSHLYILPKNGAEFLRDGLEPGHWYLGEKAARTNGNHRKQMRLRWG